MAALTGVSGTGSVNAVGEKEGCRTGSIGPRSLDGTTSPPASWLFDTDSVNWTIDGTGHVLRNAVTNATGSASAITQLLWYNGAIYAFNGTNWLKNGSPWTVVGTTDPRVSADGAIIPPAAFLTDIALNQWTLVGGVVKLNGANAGFTAAVTAVLWYGGVIYQSNNQGGWWSWNGTAWVATTDPRVSGPKLFYGVNIHTGGMNGQQYTNLGHAATIAIVKDIGFTVVRLDVGTGSVATATAWCADLAAAGITPLPILLAGWIAGDEVGSYNQGFAHGVNCANAMKNYTRYYELGNEYDDPLRIGTRQGDMLLVTCISGQPAFIGQRGSMRGAYDGVLSVQPNAQLISQGAEVLDKGYIDGMSTGQQPDGTTGHAIVQSMGIGWHWYESSGNPSASSSSRTAAPCGVPSGATNMLAFVGGYPRGNTIGAWWTEFGNNAPDTEAQQNSWYNGASSLSLMYGTRVANNITNFCLYQLLYDPLTDGGNYGICNSDGSYRLAANSIKAFIAANPDTKSTAATTATFWGISAHLGLGGVYDSTPIATQITQMIDVGIKLYRSDVIDGTTATNLGAFAVQAKASGISTLATVGPNGSDWGGTTETTCYNTWKAIAVTAANALKGKVAAYEAGNEMENAVLIGGGDGNLPADYDNTLFSQARGVINGIIDGIRSVDTVTPIVLNPVGWLHFGFTDMLLTGHSPDGTTGHQIPASFQGIGYHWYSDMQNIEAAVGGTGTYNVLAHCRDTYAKPIWLTEYGVLPGFGTEAQIITYLTGAQMMADWVRVAATYNIVNTCLYELYDDVNGNWGLITGDGATHKARYASVKSFIAANPK